MGLELLSCHVPAGPAGTAAFLLLRLRPQPMPCLPAEADHVAGAPGLLACSCLSCMLPAAVELENSGGSDPPRC